MVDIVLYAILALPFVPLIAIQVIWHLLPEERKKELLQKSFVKKDLPKIWEKCGLTSSIWTATVWCLRDGSRMYASTGAWHDMYGDDHARTNMTLTCPTCGLVFA